MRTSDQLLAELRTLHPRLIDLSLGRIERLLAKLGNPEARLPPVIHVAGTNGKGSTTAFLKAMLEAAGKRVHVYTSPHLVRFNERIELAGADGKAAPDQRGRARRRAVAHAARQCRRRHHLLRDHDGRRLSGLRRAPGRCDDPGGGPRRPPRCHQRRRAAGALCHHAHLARPSGQARRHARRRSPARRPASSRPACPPSSRASRTKRWRSFAAGPTRWARRSSCGARTTRPSSSAAASSTRAPSGCMDLALPALIGHHQIGNAGTAIAAALRLRSAGRHRCRHRARASRRALAGAHAAARQRPPVAPARRRLRAVARRRA